MRSVLVHTSQIKHLIFSQIAKTSGTKKLQLITKRLHPYQTNRIQSDNFRALSHSIFPLFLYAKFMLTIKNPSPFPKTKRDPLYRFIRLLHRTSVLLSCAPAGASVSDACTQASMHHTLHNKPDRRGLRFRHRSARHRLPTQIR